jgi:hypothetical protein
MGRCEEANASVAIKIPLCDIIDLLCQDNYTIINEILDICIIEDENERLNNDYQNIIEQMYNHTKKYKNNEITITEFKQFFSGYIKSSSIHNSYILFPLYSILETERWGYSRSGKNASCIDIDSVKSIINKEIPEKYRFLSKYPIVFMICQSSG